MADENRLDGDLVWPMFANHCLQFGEDDAESLREFAGPGLHHATVYQLGAPTLRLDEAITGSARAGIDAEDSHKYVIPEIAEQ